MKCVDGRSSAVFYVIHTDVWQDHNLDKDLFVELLGNTPGNVPS